MYKRQVQRDILPIVEGSTVVTKYGAVKTDHILFIAAGAFHMKMCIRDRVKRGRIQPELHSPETFCGTFIFKIFAKGGLPCRGGLEQSVDPPPGKKITQIFILPAGRSLIRGA